MAGLEHNTKEVFAHAGEPLAVVAVHPNGMLEVRNAAGKTAAHPPGLFREFGQGGGEGRLWVTRKWAGEPSPADKARAAAARQARYDSEDNRHLEMREVSPAELADQHRDGDAASGAALLALKIARANERADQDAAVSVNKNGTLTVWVGTDRPVMALHVSERGGRLALSDGNRTKAVPADDPAAQALWAHRLMGYRAPKAPAAFAAEAPACFTPWAQEACV